MINRYIEEDYGSRPRDFQEKLTDNVGLGLHAKLQLGVNRR